MHVLMDRAVSNRTNRPPLQFPQLVDRVIGIQKKHQVVVIISAVIISFASLFSAANLETEFDLGDFLGLLPQGRGGDEKYFPAIHGLCLIQQGICRRLAHGDTFGSGEP